MGLFSCFGGQPALVETIEQPNKKHDAGICLKYRMFHRRSRFCNTGTLFVDMFSNKMKFQNQFSGKSLR